MINDWLSLTNRAQQFSMLRALPYDAHNSLSALQLPPAPALGCTCLGLEALDLVPHAKATAARRERCIRIEQHTRRIPSLTSLPSSVPRDLQRREMELNGSGDQHTQRPHA